jgi:2-amino-4-hydroxy-6-hydroxymethyldihydropteridine diphosphokinase
MNDHRIYLGLGSNLGDRKCNLEEAILQISKFAVIKKASSIYATEPWGLKDQPQFLNQVLFVESALKPDELLSQLKIIEKKMGRKRSVRFGPRLIDLDILFYDDLILNSPELTIPHPRLRERAFVLVPLAEIAPKLVHPLDHKTVKELLQDVDLSSVLTSKE